MLGMNYRILALTMKNYTRDKIIYPNMTKFLPFVYDQDRFYTNQKCFIITGGDHLKYLVGCLNSTISAKWIRENCPELQGGTRELSKVFFQNLPIPVPNQAQKEQVSLLVDSMCLIKKNYSGLRPSVDRAQIKEQIKQIDRQINMTIYKLYSLTPEEISMLEKAD